MLAPLLPMSVGHYIFGASVICGARHDIMEQVIYICIYIVERHACEQYHKHFVVYQYILQSHDNFHSSIHSFIVSMQL